MTNLLCFDVESSGVEVFEDRIVQAFLGLMDDTGSFTQSLTWLIDPGIEIPEGAAAVHGYTTERIRALGRKDVSHALEEILNIIEVECMAGGLPLVIFNAAFDTSILNAELRRYGLRELDYTKINVIDPYTIDKRLHTFRKGKRTLTTIAPYYGVPVEDDAHDAGADCLMTGRIALKQLREPALLGHTLPALHQSQIGWHRQQAESLQQYFRSAKNKNGADPTAVVDPAWPVRNPEPERTAA